MSLTLSLQEGHYSLYSCWPIFMTLQFRGTELGGSTLNCTHCIYTSSACMYNSKRYCTYQTAFDATTYCESLLIFFQVWGYEICKWAHWQELGNRRFVSCFLWDTDLAVLKSQTQSSENADHKCSIYWSARILMSVHEVLSHGVRIAVCWTMGATRVIELIICDILKSHPYATHWQISYFFLLNLFPARQCDSHTAVHSIFCL